MEQILPAIIGAIGLVVAALIGNLRKKRRGTKVDVVERDVIQGDAIAGNKFITNEHVHVGGPDLERKSGFVFFLERVFTFGFTLIFSGVFFVAIGLTAAQEPGGVVGGVLALIAACVSAGNVKRTKGLA